MLNITCKITLLNDTEIQKVLQKTYRKFDCEKID